MNLIRSILLFLAGAAAGAAANHYGGEWQRDRELDVLEAEVQAMASAPFDADRFVAAGRRMHELGHDGGSARLGAMDETLLAHTERELIAALDSGAPCLGAEHAERIHASLKLAFTGEHSAGAELMWQRYSLARDRRIFETLQALSPMERTAVHKEITACSQRFPQSSL